MLVFWKHRYLWYALLLVAESGDSVAEGSGAWTSNGFPGDSAHGSGQIEAELIGAHL